jgi:SAM-dependent methyltransferase
MFAETPELYDQIYGSFKDYEAEVSQIAEVLAQEIPGARHVLDVGCGTAEHARLLHTRHGYQVAGLDIEPGFVGLAREKLPEADFWTGDMADFSLDRSFDVILCLFSAIGYVLTLDRLQSALSSFHAHLSPGGLALVEPWFEPGAWSHGRVFVHTAESDDLSIVRMSHSGQGDGRSSDHGDGGGNGKHFS